MAFCMKEDEDHLPGRISISIAWLMAGGPPGTCLRAARRQGMTPRHDELDHFLCDLPFPQEHVQHFVLKDLFQGLCVQSMGHLERSVSI